MTFDLDVVYVAPEGIVHYTPATSDTATYRQSLIAAGGTEPSSTSRVTPPAFPAANASVCAHSSKSVMSISRHIVVSVGTCCCACSGLCVGGRVCPGRGSHSSLRRRCPHAFRSPDADAGSNDSEGLHGDTPDLTP